MKAIDCLLLNPPDLPSRYPYLGLCNMAGLLRENGINVAILDSSALGLTQADVIQHIQNTKPRIIGISVMSLNLRNSYELMKAIQDQCPQGTLVVGGAHINAAPESVQDLGVEYGFHGECEYQFLDFCKCILGGGKPMQVPGLILCRDRALSIRETPIVEELDRLPMPAFDLLPTEKYFTPSTKRRTISFISSRGCPYNCIFCSKLQKSKYRFLSVENTIQQLEWLIHHMGIEWVEFVDEIFTLSREHVAELCSTMIARGLKFEWGCGTRADRIDEELLVLMKAAGCRKIGFGVESGVERLRWLARKQITNAQVIDAIGMCRRHKIKTQTCFILGHPTETLVEMGETVRFARRLRTNYPAFGRMIPIPGSELFEQAKKNGEVAPDVWKDFMLGKGESPIYTPRGTTAAEVVRIFRKAWVFTYFWPPNLWLNRDIFMDWNYLKLGAKAFWEFAFSRDF